MTSSGGRAAKAMRWLVLVLWVVVVADTVQHNANLQVRDPIITASVSRVFSPSPVSGLPRPPGNGHDTSGAHFPTLTILRKR